MKPPPPGTTADLNITYTEDESLGGTAGCAQAFPVAGTVYWGMTLRNRKLFLGDDEFAAVMMHEIGHFLGLAHSASGIMKQGNNCATPAGATNVTAADGQEVADCFAGFCTQLHAGPKPTPTPTSGPCMDHYRFVAVYNSEGDILGYQAEWVGCY